MRYPATSRRNFCLFLAFALVSSTIGCSTFKNSKKENLEKLNSKIASYRYIYYDLLNTAKLLEKRAKKIQAKEKDNKENKDAA